MNGPLDIDEVVPVLEAGPHYRVLIQSKNWTHPEWYKEDYFSFHNSEDCCCSSRE